MVMIQQWWIVRTVTEDGIHISEMQDALEGTFSPKNIEKMQVVEMPEADREHYDKLAVLSDHIAAEITYVINDG